MTGPTPRPESGMRLLALVGAILATLAGPSRDARADIPSPGTAPVRSAVRLEWGPLEGRIARPVTAIAGDTWDATATRETASAAWAPTIRALNGGGDAPKAGGETWVPPKALAFGAKEPFFAAFLDSAKFGRDSDVSRTGFNLLDPGRATHDVFGSVTLALLSIRGPEDATLAASNGSRRAAKETIRTPAPNVRIVELGQAIDSVASGSPIRRVVSTWRCESLANDGGVSFTRVGQESYDADGAPLRGNAEASVGVSYGFIAGGVVVLALLALFFARRRARVSR